MLDVIISISVALIAVAFTVLVIFLASTLKSVKHTLAQLASTTESLEKQLDKVTSETTELLHKTNQLAADVNEKSKSLNKAVYAFRDVGETITDFNQKIRRTTNEISERVLTDSEKIAQVIQWSHAAMNLWEKWQNRKVIKKEEE